MPAEGESPEAPLTASREPTGASPGTGGERAFLSHASADRAFAESLAAHLEQHGIGCWMAPRDVPAGALYAEAIIHAISDARALLLILSEHSVASAHVGKELERASSKRRPIIALRLDSAPLTPAFEYFLSESQWIEVQSLGRDGALAKLVEALKRPGAAPHATPAAMRRPGRSRLALGLGALTVLALIGIGALVYQRTKPPSAPAAAADLRSIAVLPFADMSQAHDQDYFADGMAEEILDLLAKTPSLKVIARSSSFQFKGKSEDARVIGERLGVATLLEGSVRKAGSRLRITAQLIRASDGSHLWSETYDRDVSDVFRTQDEIAEAVVRALRVSLLGAPAERPTPTTSSDAYAAYLRGMQHWASNTAEGSKAAAVDLQQAVQLDPNFAAAWAALALVYADQTVYGSLFGSTEQAHQLIRETARRAIELDPKLAEAHIALFAVAYTSLDAAAAEREAATAVELAPNSVQALIAASFSALMQIRLDQATDYARQAIARDPLMVDNYRALATAYWLGGNLKAAAAEYRTVLALRPDAESFHYRLAQVLVCDGQAEAAMHELDAERSIQWQRIGRTMALDALGRHAEADRVLADAIRDGAGWEYQIAEIYSNRGDREHALDWLERAERLHDSGVLLYMRADPMVAPLRTEPRFQALVKKLYPHE